MNSIERTLGVNFYFQLAELGRDKIDEQETYDFVKVAEKVALFIPITILGLIETYVRLILTAPLAAAILPFTAIVYLPSLIGASCFHFETCQKVVDLFNNCFRFIAIVFGVLDLYEGELEGSDEDKLLDELAGLVPVYTSPALEGVLDQRAKVSQLTELLDEAAQEVQVAQENYGLVLQAASTARPEDIGIVDELEAQGDKVVQALEKYEGLRQETEVAQTALARSIVSGAESLSVQASALQQEQPLVIGASV